MEINLFLLTNEVVFCGPEQPSSIVLIQHSGSQRQTFAHRGRNWAIWGFWWNLRGSPGLVFGCMRCKEQRFRARRGRQQDRRVVWPSPGGFCYPGAIELRLCPLLFGNRPGSFTALSSNCQVSPGCGFGKREDWCAMKRNLRWQRVNAL